MNRLDALRALARAIEAANALNAERDHDRYVARLYLAGDLLDDADEVRNVALFVSTRARRRFKYTTAAPADPCARIARAGVVARDVEEADTRRVRCVFAYTPAWALPHEHAADDVARDEAERTLDRLRRTLRVRD